MLGFPEFAGMTGEGWPPYGPPLRRGTGRHERMREYVTRPPPLCGGGRASVGWG